MHHSIRLLLVHIFKGVLLQKATPDYATNFACCFCSVPTHNTTPKTFFVLLQPAALPFLFLLIAVHFNNSQIHFVLFWTRGFPHHKHASHLYWLLSWAHSPPHIKHPSTHTLPYNKNSSSTQTNHIMQSFMLYWKTILMGMLSSLNIYVQLKERKKSIDLSNDETATTMKPFYLIWFCNT